MTALVSTLAGQCSHVDSHFLAQHTINFPQLSLMTTKALGTPPPCSLIPLEKRPNGGGPKCFMEECPWSKDGDEERWTSVLLLPPFLKAVIVGLPRDSSGQGPRRGYPDASGSSLWKWRCQWTFRGFLTGQQPNGEIKDLYFGPRHAELSHNQATISFCGFRPKGLHRLLMRFSLSSQALWGREVTPETLCNVP